MRIINEKLVKLKESNSSLELETEKLRKADELNRVEISKLKSTEEKLNVKLEYLNKDLDNKDKIISSNERKIKNLKFEKENLERELRSKLERYENKENLKQQCLEKMKNGIQTIRNDFKRNKSSGLSNNIRNEFDYNNKKEMNSKIREDKCKNQFDDLTLKIKKNGKGKLSKLDAFKNEFYYPVKTEVNQDIKDYQNIKIKRLNKLMSNLKNDRKMSSESKFNSNTLLKNNSQKSFNYEFTNVNTDTNNTYRKMKYENRREFNEKLDAISRSLSKSSSGNIKNDKYEKYRNYRNLDYGYDDEERNFRKDKYTVHPHFKYSPKHRSISNSPEYTNRICDKNSLLSTNSKLEETIKNLKYPRIRHNSTSNSKSRSISKTNSNMNIKDSYSFKISK